MTTLRDRIFQDLDNLVENGYAADWNETGQSIYDADPKEVVADSIEQTGELENADDATLDAAANYVREWQATRR